MVRSTSSQTFAFTLFFTLLCAFATLTPTAEARPTVRLSQTAASFEPLARPAAPFVGPQRSLERLRLRRRAINLPIVKLRSTSLPRLENPKFRRAEVENPSVSLVDTTAAPIDLALLERSTASTNEVDLLLARSAAPSPTVTALLNPKKRWVDAKQKRDLHMPVPLQNPKKRWLAEDREKAKRALVEPASVLLNPKAKRSVPAAVIVNPKAKRAVPTSTVTSPTRRALDDLPKPRRRSLLQLLSSVISRTNLAAKAKRNTIHFGAGSLPNVLLPRQFTPPRIGIVGVVPNPKSNNYASISASIESSMATSTAKPTSTRTRSRSTTTTRTTTMRTTTTTTVRATTTTTTTTTPSAPVATGTKWPTGDFVSSAYYPDWNGAILPPKDVDMDLYDLIFYAFAIPTTSYDVEFLQWNSGTLLRELVSYAHGNNTKVVISIGGWTGSGLFSYAVNTRANRATFIANIVAMVNEYGVDGVDIDWEYPGTSGAAGNVISSKDTANYLTFLTGLRAALGTDAHISTCTTHRPFIGADGSPLADVTAFANVLDSILVMNYDVWGASSTPGPNAPLSNACANSNQPTANEESAIAAWTAAGWPASKILMGVPAYGYISSSSATTLINKRSIDGVDVDLRAHDPRFDHMSKRERSAILYAEEQMSPLHRWFEAGQRTVAKRRAEAEEFQKRATPIFCPNDHSGNPCAGVQGQNVTTIDWNPLNVTRNANGTVSGGVFNGGAGIGKLGNGNLAAVDGNQIQFYQLISYGVLVQEGTTDEFTAVNGYVRQWDACSSTPYLYNTARKTVITYDDPQSLTLKGQMAASKRIQGIGMWDMTGDTVDWQLVKAFRSGMGMN